MQELQTNPIIIILMFVVRCAVPMAIMLGITYLLRRFGFIKGPATPPADWENNRKNNSEGGNLL
jgi:hypothetical protein